MAFVYLVRAIRLGDRAKSVSKVLVVSWQECMKMLVVPRINEIVGHAKIVWKWWLIESNMFLEIVPRVYQEYWSYHENVGRAKIVWKWWIIVKCAKNI